MEAGDVDACPDCGTRFRVPGAKQRQQHEEQLAKERAAKEESQRVAAEERRLANEERKLELARRESREAEERRKQQLILAKQEEEQRRQELASLNPRYVRGEIVDPSPGHSDLAECPFCAETISLRARKCKHCGELLDPTLRAAAEAQRASGGVQIVNMVEGGSASATASAKAEAKNENDSCVQQGCGCLALLFIFGIIAAAMGGCAVVG